MTAFMLMCFFGVQIEDGIYFKNVNDCISYKKKLHNQVIIRNNKDEVYQCMCKLVPSVDTDKVKVY
jgi:hypothetical protein|tara:strand:+ start:345 stop:542 length:198 start_codon:yes stop_codon:yes gene_type:complete